MAKQYPCPVPGCPRNRRMTSGFGVCAVHDDLFRGITYYMQQAQKELAQAQRKGQRPGEKVTQSGLILP